MNSLLSAYPELTPALILRIFNDSFFAHLIFTFNYDFAYEFAVYFGHNPYIVSMVSLAGSLCGITSSFAVFYILGGVFKKSLESSYNYRPLKHYFNKYRYIVSCLVAFPTISVVIPFFAGLLRIKPGSMIMIFLFYRLVYYFYFVSTVAL